MTRKTALLGLCALGSLASAALAAATWTPPPSPPAGPYTGFFDYDSGPVGGVGFYIITTPANGTLEIQENDPSLDPAKKTLLDQGINEADNNNTVTLDAAGNVTAVATL